MRRVLSYSVPPILFWLLLSGHGLGVLGSEGLGAQERSYQDMRAEVVELYGEERFAEAAEILTDALGQYPDHIMANCVNLALMHVRMETVDKGLEALLYGLDHEIWYGKYAFLDPIWEPLKGAVGWGAFEDRNRKAKELAARDVEPRLEVVLPETYDPSRSYPLFLALHGGGENVDLFMPNWGSPVLAREFIVAFPQSTQLIAMNGYNWTEDIPGSLKEIGEAYEEVAARYPVDKDQIFVGGFSSGGVASLEVALKGTLPVRGFVVLCPAMPDDFSPEAVRAASERGIRGTLLTTEMDGRVDQQKKMAEIMKEEGLPLEFHITPDIGHWYPDDLAARIDEAIAHIRGEG